MAIYLYGHGRAKLAARGKPGAPELGLFQTGSHHVTTIPDCNSAAVIASGTQTPADPRRPPQTPADPQALADHGSNKILGSNWLLVHGPEWAWQEFGGVQLALAPGSFVQTVSSPANIALCHPADAVIVCFAPSAVLLADLLSPAASLRAPADSSSQQATQECHQLQQEQGQEPPSAVTPWCKAGEAAGAALLCPGSGGPSEEGFVLHTSQSYSRVSQPAISPNVAAGLAAPADDEEEPAEEQFTTPSQDSKEPPQHSPSNVTDISHDGQGDSSIAAFGQLQPQPPVAVVAPAGLIQCSAAVAAVPAAADGEAGPSRFGSNTSTDDVFILPAAIAAAAAVDAAASAAATPGDNLSLLLGDDVIGEATTPELELVCGASQEQPGSQPSGAAAAATAIGIVNGAEAAGAYNKHDSLSKNWSDPTIFDAPLTQKGRLQCVAAREAVQKLLDKWGHMGSVLWLSSPLTRALETMTLVWPDVEHLAQQQGQTQQAQGRGRVAILSTIAEHCHTSGDVGVPASHLRQRWPSFASQLDELQEHWWHNPDPRKAPNCAVRRLFYRNERVDEMRHRVSEFTRWLGQQPEQVVVAFGHSTFWKYFSNSKSRMKNCEVRQMLW
eukprot:gene2533-2835_t